jgi:hypothetical protein
VEVRSSEFYIVMFVLPRSAFRRDNSTTVNFFEVAIGEFVSSLVLLVFLIINPQVPFGVFVNPVQADELILLLCGRLVFETELPRNVEVVWVGIKGACVISAPLRARREVWQPRL